MSLRIAFTSFRQMGASCRVYGLTLSSHHAINGSLNDIADAEEAVFPQSFPHKAVCNLPKRMP